MSFLFQRDCVYLFSRSGWDKMSKSVYQEVIAGLNEHYLEFLIQFFMNETACSVWLKYHKVLPMTTLYKVGCPFFMWTFPVPCVESCLLSKLHYLILWVNPTKPLVSFHTKIKRQTFILVPFCFFHCDIVIYLLKLKIKTKCLLNYTKYYVNNIKLYVKLFKYLILYTNTFIYL